MIDFIFSNESQREPAREDLHINGRQSGRVTDDMAAGRDKDRCRWRRRNGGYVGPVGFHMATEGSPIPRLGDIMTEIWRASATYKTNRAPSPAEHWATWRPHERDRRRLETRQDVHKQRKDSRVQVSA